MVMPSKIAGIRRNRRKVRYESGPWRGMRDSFDTSAIRRELLQSAIDCYPFQGSYVARPGYQKMGATFPGGGKGQRVYQYTKLNGTEFTVGICGGRFQTYNWATSTWTEVLTTANLTSATVTLSTTARVYCVTLANLLIVSDGVNTPWAWDGTTNGGITKLTNCPVLYGQPTIYYNKLFGIKNTERSTIVWSEENDPVTGYEAGGFNNAWTLGQSDPDALFVIRGTNTALVFWRAFSVGAIYGAVNDDFVTSGTQDSISTTIGSSSPDCVFQYKDAFFFLDSNNHPQRMTIGSGVQEPQIWLDAKETIREGSSVATIGDAAGVFDVSTGMALVSVRNSISATSASGTQKNMAFVFDGPSGQHVARWQYDGAWESLDIAKNTSGLPCVVHTDTVGRVFEHGTPDGTGYAGGIWTDEGSPHYVSIKLFIGADSFDEKQFDRTDVVFRLGGSSIPIHCKYQVPRTNTVTTAGAVTVNSNTGPFNNVNEFHQAFGLNANGRWMLLNIEEAQGGTTQHGIDKLTVDAFIIAPFPEAK